MKVMMTTANIISEYFQRMDFQWHTETDEDINGAIYGMKKQSKKKNINNGKAKVVDD